MNNASAAAAATHIVPQVYVACLASYNAGIHHGRWIDATDADEIRENIAEMLAASPVPGAEEWAIHDHNGFHPIFIGGSTSADDLAGYASLIEHCDGSPEIAACMLDNAGNIDEARKFYGSHYAGSWNSLTDFAENLWEVTMLDSVPEMVARYIDYDAVARDLSLNGDVFTVEVDGETHVFWNR